MKLLYFAPHQIWPANTGARLRDYHLARELATQTSVTFVEMSSAGERKSVPPADSGLDRIATIGKDRPYSLSKILLGIVGATPVTILNCYSKRSISEFADVIRSSTFDTAQIEGVLLTKYIPLVEQLVPRPAIVVDWHNIESELMWRYARLIPNRTKKIVAMRTAKLLERAEDHLLRNYKTHTVSSERERQKLLNRCPSADIQVIPNGIDTERFSQKEIVEVTNPKSEETILFVGSMDYHANIDAVIWFTRTAWPQIAQKHPNLHFTIVGRDPVPEIRALSTDRIHVTGTVDDVRPFYSSAVAAVAPIRSGSGTRLKILEAMAAGVPVVSTRLGAEGIDVEHDVDILLAETALEFAAAIRLIYSTPQKRAGLASAARTLACATYDWSVIGEKLRAIHGRLVGQRGPCAPVRS